MRDIPDWMTHLERDRRGLPVPYINRYGPEDPNRMRIAPDRHAGGHQALFMDDDPAEPVDFTKQHHGRQRECMAAGLCQVCAQPVPWSRRLLVIATVSVETVDVTGLGRRIVVTEPWLCERCCIFAVRVCPALIRQTRADELVVVTITAQRDATLICSRGFVDEGPVAEESKRLQPVMWNKLALTRHAWDTAHRVDL